MNRVSFEGVAIGNVVDILPTNVVMVPVIICGLYLLGAGSDPTAAMEILRKTPAYLAASSLLGGLCSILGGYVSARIAKRDDLLNGALSSVLCVGLGVYALVHGASPLWLHLLFLPLSPALGALGGYLRWRQSARIA